MREISRSSYQAFDDCPRKGYWSYLYKGGLSPIDTPLPLLLGVVVHKGMEEMMLGEEDDAKLTDIMLEEWADQGGGVTSKQDEENFQLARALVLGWKRSRLEGFHARFEILSVEKQLNIPIVTNIILQARADIVVRSRMDGSVWVWNWKTTSSTKDWTEKWKYDIQSMTEALSVQEDLGFPVQGCIFEGLYKGTKYNGSSTSPLITGLYDGADWKSKGRSSKNIRRLPVWKSYPGGLTSWLDALDPDILDEQFIRSSPVFKNDPVVHDFLKQLVKEETDNEMMLLKEVPEEDRLLHFRTKRGMRCKWCNFSDACWNGVPVESLLVKPRIPHHKPLDKQAPGA